VFSVQRSVCSVEFLPSMSLQFFVPLQTCYRLDFVLIFSRL
jgi:hypothetical protein